MRKEPYGPSGDIERVLPALDTRDVTSRDGGVTAPREGDGAVGLDGVTARRAPRVCL